MESTRVCRRCIESKPISQFVNLRDSTKTTQICLTCRQTKNDTVCIFIYVLLFYLTNYL